MNIQGKWSLKVRAKGAALISLDIIGVPDKVYMPYGLERVLVDALNAVDLQLDDVEAVFTFVGSDNIVTDK